MPLLLWLLLLLLMPLMWLLVLFLLSRDGTTCAHTSPAQALPFSARTLKEQPTVQENSHRCTRQYVMASHAWYARHISQCGSSVMIPGWYPPPLPSRLFILSFSEGYETETVFQEGTECVTGGDKESRPM